ncbi:hypothetical protein FJV83_28410 [Mesorhizobium sp. WSM4307]|nr:hypothetical protein FJV81_10655 [Mesorhizobium sp. WSM4315]TRC79223.1 hypothetical protein FJV83_28410 [Mesorhizobium sp. WSM4307]TRC80195.1 hypothetical protein FJV80_22765 [Mesorhizobium sp. WSM4310]TRC92159.1 hypothetical protein FJV82_32580 [Mesorhizobium sp. WSM4305]
MSPIFSKRRAWPLASFCDALSSRGVEVIKTSGDYHFDGNYARLAEQILAGFNRRVAARM